MGTSDGSIIATIIMTHMPRNDAAAPGQLCAGIHAIDIVQPPGIVIAPIAIDAHPTIVNAALAVKSNAETPTKAASDGMRREITRRMIA